MNPEIVVSSKLYDVTLILFCRVCGVQLVMPNGVVTKGMVPPYPRVLRWVPINGLTYDAASFSAARPEKEPTHSIKRPTAILFITGNCNLHAYAATKPYGLARIETILQGAFGYDEPTQSTDHLFDERVGKHHSATVHRKYP